MELKNRPEINPHLYGQLILDKEDKNIQWGKDHSFKKWCFENWTDTCTKSESRPSSYNIYKNKIKRIKGLNVILKTIKLIEEIIGSKIYEISLSNIFSTVSPRARETKEKHKN